MRYEDVCSLRITSESKEYLDFVQKLLDEKTVESIMHQQYIFGIRTKYEAEITIIRPKEEKNDQN